MAVLVAIRDIGLAVAAGAALGGLLLLALAARPTLPDRAARKSGGQLRGNARTGVSVRAEKDI